jgi:hypothetical protein
VANAAALQSAQALQVITVVERKGAAPECESGSEVEVEIEGEGHGEGEGEDDDEGEGEGVSEGDGESVSEGDGESEGESENEGEGEGDDEDEDGAGAALLRSLALLPRLRRVKLCSSGWGGPKSVLALIQLGAARPGLEVAVE